MAENFLWLTWSIISAVLWIPVKSDDSSRSIARQSTQVTSKQGKTMGLLLGSECLLGTAADVQSIVCYFRQKYVPFHGFWCCSKPYKIWLSKGLKAELCRLEKNFKIMKPNCTRYTKLLFLGISMVWNALMRMWFTLHIPVMLYIQSYGSFPSFPLSKSKLLLSVVSVWIWFKTFPYLRSCTFSHNSLGKETQVKFNLHPGVVNVLNSTCTAPAARLWYNENVLLKCVWLKWVLWLGGFPLVKLVIKLVAHLVKLFSVLPATEQRVPGCLN